MVLDLGKVNGTVSVYVNGLKTGAVNLNTCRVDISQTLHAGSNDLKIVVTTPLGNRLAAEGWYGKDNSNPRPFSIPVREAGDYGLLGPVQIIPHTTEMIKVKGQVGQKK